VPGTHRWVHENEVHALGISLQRERNAQNHGRLALGESSLSQRVRRPADRARCDPIGGVSSGGRLGKEQVEVERHEAEADRRRELLSRLRAGSESGVRQPGPGWMEPQLQRGHTV
jgi:hypothetical protein